MITPTLSHLSPAEQHSLLTSHTLLWVDETLLLVDESLLLTDLALEKSLLETLLRRAGLLYWHDALDTSTGAADAVGLAGVANHPGAIESWGLVC